MIEPKQDLLDLLDEASLSIHSCIQRSAKYSIDQPMFPLSPETTQEQSPSLSIFDKMGDLNIDPNLQSKITNLKFTQFTQRRRDEFFKRFKKEQEEKLINSKKNAERIYHSKDGNQKLTKGEFTLKNAALNRTQTFPISAQDMQKLKPEMDLNDTIISNYLKLLQFVFLPEQIDKKCHIFSSFFLEKLIGEVLKQEFMMENDMETMVEQVREKARQNYKNVKRWTKRIDIFEKEVLVFPINAFKHWNCILVLRPNLILSHQCQIIVCDSMFEKKEFLVEAIRKYIQQELHEKKGIMIDINPTNTPSYQLLLPRQTNNHDCGLYMLSYIEQLLSQPNELENLAVIKNRKKLSLFPRTLIYTMRERLRNLFTRLINAKEQQKNDILAEYIGERQRLKSEIVEPQDYDIINNKEYRKFQKINLAGIQGSTPQQKSFACQIKFYLDPQINYYQK